MVFKKSEYQNQFKPSTVSKGQSAYLENLTFRHERRDREFVHTPLAWYNQSNEPVVSSDEEDNESANCNIKSKAVKEIVEPEYQSLAEILDASKAKSVAFRQQKKENTLTSSKENFELGKFDSLSLGDKQDSTLKIKEAEDSLKPEESLCSKKPLQENPVFQNIKVNAATDTCDENNLKVSPANLRKKGSRKKKPCSSSIQRPTSAPKEKEPNGKYNMVSQVPALAIGSKPRRPDRQKRIPSAKQCGVSQERPPFVVYGAGDIEDTFTTHRTHNVRSVVDVYGPALRAKLRREEEKKRQLEKQRRLAKSTSDLLDKLASATPRDMVDWRSEYQKEYHGYEPKVYERSSSRAIIPHSAPIRAVHRGGGLIVHVD